MLRFAVAKADAQVHREGMESESNGIVTAVNAEEAAAVLTRVGALTEGHFLLSSGLHSPQYFQCAKLLEYPRAAEPVAEAVAAICAPWGAETVISPALGAVLFGHELARVLGIRHLFAERPTGRFELRRGFELSPGEKVLLAENVTTTGGSVLEVADLVRSLGAEVVGYAIIVERSGGRFAPPEPVAAYAAMDAKTFQPDQCPLCAQGEPLVKPGSRSFTAQ